MISHNRLIAVLLLLAVGFLPLACQGPSGESSGSASEPSANPNIDATVYQYEEHVDESVDAVGFDVDDTLLFSSPAFDRGFENAEQPFSDEFWQIVNTSDELSCVKPRTRELLNRHREDGHELYAITARKPIEEDTFKSHIAQQFEIPEDHVYMEPDEKTTRLEKLDIDIYYGDSDSDITDSQDAGILGVRILRSDQSGYQDKYNPGKFDEPFVPNSAPPHGCPGQS